MDDEGLDAVITNGTSICPTFTFLANLADFVPEFRQAQEWKIF